MLLSRTGSGGEAMLRSLVEDRLERIMSDTTCIVKKMMTAYEILGRF